VRIATRGSELALWQARHVRDLLLTASACDSVELVIVETSGDRDTETPLHTIGGKGVFVKEVQTAVLDGRADLAVHSAKDLPALTPDGLLIGAVPERGDPRDALVGSTLEALSDGAVVATGSARRRAQLFALRPDLRFAELRGNVVTRLTKAPAFDAIVMAAVAVQRLALDPPIVDVISVEQMVPQVGQGSLAVECRNDDEHAVAALAQIDHAASRRRLDAERAFLRTLGGDCSLPAGAYAVELASGELEVTGFLATDDLTRHDQLRVVGCDGPSIGAELASTLRTRLEIE
jgi:hydroxymethylbilane synthase